MVYQFIASFHSKLKCYSRLESVLCSNLSRKWFNQHLDETPCRWFQENTKSDTDRQGKCVHRGDPRRPVWWPCLWAERLQGNRPCSTGRWLPPHATDAQGNDEEPRELERIKFRQKLKKKKKSLKYWLYQRNLPCPKESSCRFWRGCLLWKPAACIDPRLEGPWNYSIIFKK